MEKFKIERIFDYPLSETVDFFMEGEDTVYDLKQLENVTQWKVLKEDDSPEKRVGTKEWCAHAQIPKVLQHIISPKMLTWYEHSEWDKIHKVYRFKIEPIYLSKKLKCQGQTTFTQAPGNKTSRTFRIMIDVHIPVLGSVAEKLIVDLLRKNEEQDYALGTEALEKAMSALFKS
jgi:hypothetical protein